MSTPVDGSVPISLVLHTKFCPRRTWLEANGEVTDTYQMQAGHQGHRRVDDPTSSRPHQLRQLAISDPALGIHGRADVAEPESDGSIHVVEYKTAPLRDVVAATPAHKVQLALQTMCLESAGHRVSRATVRFVDSRLSEEVPITDELRAQAVELVDETRQIIASPTAPAPLIDDARCSKCSHMPVCLPDEKQGVPVRRRINAKKPVGSVIHLTEQGSRCSVKTGRLIVKKRGEELGSVPLGRVDGVTVHGNVDVSSAAIRELSWHQKAVVWCSFSGRVYSWTQPASSPNGLSRSRQHELASDDFLSLAKQMIETKISNQRTLLRRNGDCPRPVEDLAILTQQVDAAISRNELFGIEGAAAKAYFSGFTSMLKHGAKNKYQFDFPGREGRGSIDPINVLLNYAYGMLTSECLRALVSIGLDPHIGVLHSSYRNKPALALDLMEEFRPTIADSAIISLLNRREFPLDGFVSNDLGTRLTKDGRRAVIEAVETRLSTEFNHPVYDYKVTWRRAIEVQARQVLALLEGSQERYFGVRVR
ncbi:CRISPR-associated endonuclease Cas4/Cas1 [Corynebacterium cystitidis]|uniref:CRISPR-associated endonuclease Cas1 n=1 Tax=Corynebacterium cystitidis DSM 20524 TaxID=1121357 RepID=A0A1H9ULT9_9CORY|nr:CRISPR-associated endonuclease Cas4/Cas1 [Corynebacterium cystitidis]WJY81023.1 CRISPR-associated protein Cas4/endonuclease Cas1 fusion [Corynebacterium cystitidis DSM 20524]SES10268.1 CRISP-associated protein Cas1 [Corynebacterium cystitidis DSM 20524]SNV90617.1 putative CRISPR-associated protein [Corynebacterium cystitidis]